MFLLRAKKLEKPNEIQGKMFIMVLICPIYPDLGKLVFSHYGYAYHAKNQKQ